MIVADPEDAVLAPAIRAQMRVLERKLLPRGAVRAVIFADGAPLAIGKIRSPAPPMLLAPRRFDQPALFSVHTVDCKLSGSTSTRVPCGRLITGYSGESGHDDPRLPFWQAAAQRGR